MTLHSAYAAQHGATVLAGIRNLDLGTNPEIQNDVAIGSPYPQFAAITAQRPRIAFVADQVAAALALTGSSGAVIDASDTFVAYFASLGGDGLPAAGSIHRSYTMNRGLIVPRRLTCNHRQSATLDMEALSFSANGADHPLVISDTVALPSLAIANIHHTLGAVSLGVNLAVVTFDCVQSLTIDFGNGAQSRGCDSDIYDKHMEQPGIQPVVTLTGLSAAAFGSAGVPPVGKIVEHANTSIYLRKRDAGIGFVSDATAEHIKITIDGVAVVTQHTGSGPSASEVTLQITGRRDGAGLAPLQINTASAIT